MVGRRGRPTSATFPHRGPVTTRRCSGVLRCAADMGTGTETDRHVRVDVDAERFGGAAMSQTTCTAKRSPPRSPTPAPARFQHHGCHRGDRLDRAHTPPRHPHPDGPQLGWFRLCRMVRLACRRGVGAGPFQFGDDGPSGLFEQLSGELVEGAVDPVAAVVIDPVPPPVIQTRIISNRTITITAAVTVGEPLVVGRNDRYAQHPLRLTWGAGRTTSRTLASLSG